MKKILMIIAVSLTALTSARADERPVVFNQLPAAAQAFVNTNYPGEKVSYATVEDDFVRPDYTVVLSNGVRLQFRNDGSLEKIEAKAAGVPEGLIPVQIRDYVKAHYPDAYFIEYEVGKKHHDVKLSNRLELKFNRHYNIIEIDD